MIRGVIHLEYGPATPTDQLIITQGMLSMLSKEIKENGHEVPTSLSDALVEATRDVNERLRADRLKTLKALELQRNKYLTADEKKAKIDAEIAKLQELTK